MSPFLVVSVSRAANRGLDMTGKPAALVHKRGVDPDRVSRRSTEPVSGRLSLCFIIHFLWKCCFYYLSDLAIVLFAAQDTDVESTDEHE